MGSSGSKIAVHDIPLSRLVGAGLKRGHRQILTARLCAALFRQVSDTCQDSDVSDLRHFLARPINVAPKVQPRALDRDLIKAMHQPKRLLKPQVLAYLSLVLKHLDEIPDKPRLVSHVIQPQLSTLYVNNVVAQRGQPVSWLTRLKLLVYSVVRIKMTAKVLRKEPKIHRVKGLERAHKVSLWLAVELWKHFYGHNYVPRQQLSELRKILSQPSNIYLTCKFTNKCLHVRYDEEIMEAIKTGRSLSTGAKLRARQVHQALLKLQKEVQSVKLEGFVAKSLHEVRLLC